MKQSNMADLQLKKFSFPGLHPVDLAVRAGECVSISGDSGAGKTRLLRAICDIDPHDGEVLSNKISCANVSAPAWRRRVCLTPPESQWWFDTVGEHFTGNVEQDVGLTRLGFTNNIMSCNVQELSSGERQRLGLLRMLTNRPDVLLLDEPTANLDPANCQRVETLIREYRESGMVAVVWVSHNAAQLKRVANRHYVIEHGELKAQ